NPKKQGPETQGSTAELITGLVQLVPQASLACASSFTNAILYMQETNKQSDSQQHRNPQQSDRSSCPFLVLYAESTVGCSGTPICRQAQTKLEVALYMSLWSPDTEAVLVAMSCFRHLCEEADIRCGVDEVSVTTSCPTIIPLWSLLL
ncbi:hypothetical protein E2320_018195, partial [Naja naja]